MNVRWARRVAAAIVAAVVSVGVAGCGEVLTGGAVDLRSYPPVSPLSSPSPGSSALPAGFPDDVPVVPGRYRRIESSEQSVYYLAVDDAGANAANDARRRLTAAGFERQDFLGQATFFGAHHTVSVTIADDGFGPYLIYAVSAATVSRATGPSDREGRVG